jgi:multiple sugar transport system substrate-binding protein
MSRRSLRRRSPARLKGGLGLTALAGVTVLTLAACGGSSGSSAGGGSTPASGSTSSVGSTTSGSIVWSASPLSGTGANDARTVLINAFEKQYPNIHVTLVSASTDTDTNRSTLATQIAGGAGPDVFMGDVIWPAQFGAHQLAVPLSQYLPSS